MTAKEEKKEMYLVYTDPSNYQILFDEVEVDDFLRKNENSKSESFSNIDQIALFDIRCPIGG